MIILQMSEKEMITELLYDLEDILKYSTYKDTKFRRLVLKATTFPFFAHTEYFSRNHNHWILIYLANNKKEFGEKRQNIFFSWFNSDKGMYSVCFNLSSNPHQPRILINTPHFYSRYAQRLGLKETGVELMIRYFKNNQSSFLDYQPSERYDTEHKAGVIGSLNEGIAIGAITDNNNFIFRTFITYDMTRGEQIEKYTRTEELRKEWFGGI